MVIANTPNSKPWKGNTAKNPPKPKTLNNPIAQEGHAGAITLIAMPEDPALTLPVICLLIRKTPIDSKIPAKTDEIIKKINGKPSTKPKVPRKMEYNSLKEKFEIKIL